jgi:16S rRNA (guanine(1405)-N(7))-methyltransferase
MSDLQMVVDSVLASRKYRSVCADTVGRIAEQELVGHGSLKAAIKATKRKLHQVHGAFDQDVDYGTAYRELDAAYHTAQDAEIKAACRHLLGLHSSTRERLLILDRFYPAIFAVTGQPSVLLDVGCGLNPLAIPWMDLAPGTRYLALDIDSSRIHFLNRYLSLAGFEALARCQDVLSGLPDDRADVALLLKMSPTLERQEAGATLRLIEQLQAAYVVVSFAVRSLGGRERGMVEQYRKQFLAWIETRHLSATELIFETELGFVVHKR